MLPTLLLALMQAPLDAPQLLSLSETVHQVPGGAGRWDPVAVALDALGPMQLANARVQAPSLACPQRVLLERILGGYPVTDEVVRVNQLRDGTSVVVAALTELADFVDAPVLGADAASARAAAALGAAWAPRPQAVRLEILPLRSGARLAWRVDVLSAGSSALGMRCWIDARDGALLGARDGSRSSDGNGVVFNPNPVQSLNDATLVDNRDSGTAVPAAAYMAVTLRDLDGSGYMTGPWVTTDATPGRQFHADLDFSSNRHGDSFEEAMVYYHLDAWQRYLQSIGLNANSDQQRVNVRDRLFGMEYANASYNEITQIIALGTANVDMSEDADVFLHEYGHAIHDDVQGGIGSGQNGGMSEGYGDFYACSWFDDVILGDWVSTNPALNAGGPWPNTRRADNLNHYPEDLGNEVHQMGEVWCGGLWEMQLMVGLDVAVTLSVEGMAFQTTATNMPQAAAFLLMADQQVYGGAHQAYIEGAMRVRGIRNVPPGAAELTASDRSLLPGQPFAMQLDSPADPGAAYVVVVSRSASPSSTGSPYNATLDIGSELLNLSNHIPGLMGQLDGNGRAHFGLRAPRSAQYKDTYFAQAMVLDAAGAAVRISEPTVLRIERH